MAYKNKVTDTSFENSVEITEVLLAHKCTFRPWELNSAYKDGRNFSGFVCPVAGSAIYRPVDGEMFTVDVGEIVYLPEMSRYTIQSADKNFTHYTVNFLLQTHESEIISHFQPLFGNSPIKIGVDNFDSFKSVFAKAVSAFGTNMPGSVLLVKAQIFEIMYMFFVQAMRTKAPNGEYDLLVKAKDYIEAHFCESIRAKDLAKLCSMSETSLRRKFREYMGQPPLDYQIGLRIRRARELLLERGHNVSEVASLVGFDDVNYFSRLFKKRVGVSPHTYEKMY